MTSVSTETAVFIKRLLERELAAARREVRDARRRLDLARQPPAMSGRAISAAKATLMKRQRYAETVEAVLGDWSTELTSLV